MWKRAAVLMAICIAAGGTQAAPARCDLAAANAGDAGPGCARAWMDRNLKLNDLVSVGTHNSYKTQVPEAVMALIRAAAPDRAEELDYREPPLDRQLDAGARQLEIDVYYDPEGGRFLHPMALRAAGIVLDPARRKALARPGFKVMHVQDVDVLSSCITLKDCLRVIRHWSLAHPDHVPIMLMFNAKTDPSPEPGGAAALPFDEAAFDALDVEIRAVFPAGELITPDDVQRGYPTLREAVLHDAWPTLGEARGKVFFALDEGPDKVAVYRGTRRSLEGRLFFVDSDETSPVAAYMTINDPVADAARIRRAVEAGFIVRTRADSGTVEARANDTARRDRAIASGAQYVSTDYLWPEPKLHNDYQVRLSGEAAARCNPVRAPEHCAGLAVETAR